MKQEKEFRLIESRGEKIFNVTMNVLGVLISLEVLYPIYYTFIASISKPFFVENGTVTLLPVNITLESYKKAFQTNSIWTAYGNTIFYTVVGVVVNMAITTAKAYALSKKRLMFRKFFTLFTVFTMWFSAGIIPLYMTFKDLHLLNTRTSIILGFAVNTYNLIIMKSFRNLWKRQPSLMAQATSVFSEKFSCRCPSRHGQLWHCSMP